MSPLPVVSGRDVVSALGKKAMSTITNAVATSCCDSIENPIAKSLSPTIGRLPKAIIREAGLTVDDFPTLL